MFSIAPFPNMPTKLQRTTTHSSFFFHFFLMLFYHSILSNISFWYTEYRTCMKRKRKERSALLSSITIVFSPPYATAEPFILYILFNHQHTNIYSQIEVAILEYTQHYTILSEIHKKSKEVKKEKITMESTMRTTTTTTTTTPRRTTTTVAAFGK